MKNQSEPGRGSSYELYGRVEETLVPLLRAYASNIKQVLNLTWLVVAIMNSQSIALSELANMLPGDTEAQSRETRIREWLKNARVDVWGWYQVILRHVLRDWQGEKISLIIDGSLVFGDRMQMFRLSIAHGNRAIPLIWTVIPGKGLVKMERLRAMFKLAAEFLAPYQVSITLLADCGFRDHDWALLCRELNWHYRIRIAVG